MEDLWHQRYGHLNQKSLQKLAKDDLVEDFDFSSLGHTQFCESFLDGKQHRNPFPVQSESRAKEPLDLVHTDICVEDQLKVTNNCTRYVWIYPLKYKSEAFEKFREWKAKTELETGKKLKVFRSDSGGKFTSKEFECFLKKEGIKNQLTVPKCPQQNGTAEQMNRTLVKMVRSMLSHFKLPHKFWAEALSTAEYLRNRCPTKALPDKTQYEAFNGVKLNVGHL
uniref:Integrase catalytic domain-containing protein n=1 Tax=Amphimedon queenslandica TaxID=400682 RepID=A0A1X7VSJ8_AMPQE